MKTLLAFDCDPLFSGRPEPILRIRTRLEFGKATFSVWKEGDFFWFWIEERPDFFGLFCDDAHTHRSKLNLRSGGWFEQAAHIEDERRLRGLLKKQIHNGIWARAISFFDPRPGKSGVWRILWRGRDFLLQNAETGRAVTFQPGTQWEPKSPFWRDMSRLERPAEFFAERSAPLLLDRRGRLASAFEFLELPLEEQEQPVRFGKGTPEEFQDVLRAALILSYEWKDDEERVLGVRFYSAHKPPVLDFVGYNLPCAPRRYATSLKVEEVPRVQRLARAFEPHVVPGWSHHSVAPSPFGLQCLSNETRFKARATGPITAHEQLEAHLLVRDWVERNAPELLPDWK